MTRALTSDKWSLHASSLTRECVDQLTWELCYQDTSREKRVMSLDVRVIAAINTIMVPGWHWPLFMLRHIPVIMWLLSGYSWRKLQWTILLVENQGLTFKYSMLMLNWRADFQPMAMQCKPISGLSINSSSRVYLYFTLLRILYRCEDIY